MLDASDPEVIVEKAKKTGMVSNSLRRGIPVMITLGSQANSPNGHLICVLQQTEPDPEICHPGIKSGTSSSNLLQISCQLSRRLNVVSYHTWRMGQTFA